MDLKANPLLLRWQSTSAKNPALQAAALCALFLAATLSSAIEGEDLIIPIMLILAFAGLIVPQMLVQSEAKNATRPGSSVDATLRPRDPMHASPASGLDAAPLATGPQVVPPLVQNTVGDSTWTELMARVSHELRTPLNAVIGFSDVMDSELLGPVGHPRYREYARHIRECSRELLKSAEDTLAITSLLADPEQRGPASPVGFRTLANDAWNFLGGDARRSEVSLEIIAPRNLEIIGERRPLRQIMVNLFTEALTRAAPGSKIVVRSRTSGDLVHVEICVTGDAPQTQSTVTPSLAICLARTLLELQGARLTETIENGFGWNAATILRRATQQDFFAIAERQVPALA